MYSSLLFVVSFKHGRDTVRVEFQQRFGKSAKAWVAFVDAQYAFADPYRVIAEDSSHREQESRYYSFGRESDL